MAAPAQRASGAFTLIELLAVLFIIALVLGIRCRTCPCSDRVMLGRAQDLAAQAQLRAAARSGDRHPASRRDRPRRLRLVDRGAARNSGSVLGAPPAPSASREVSWSAAGRRAPFVPSPALRPAARLPEACSSPRSDARAGPVASGQVGLVFEEDSTADPALFVLENDRGPC
jgi:prepilin-type N-terminal cleavage/methylation domain-containing protein